MKKILARLTGVAAVIGLLVGGVFLAAPAQAVTCTSHTGGPSASVQSSGFTAYYRVCSDGYTYLDRVDVSVGGVCLATCLGLSTHAVFVVRRYQPNWGQPVVIAWQQDEGIIFTDFGPPPPVYPGVRFESSLHPYFHLWETLAGTSSWRNSPILRMS